MTFQRLIQWIILRKMKQNSWMKVLIVDKSSEKNQKCGKRAAASGKNAAALCFGITVKAKHS